MVLLFLQPLEGGNLQFANFEAQKNNEKTIYQENLSA